jgi:hypothetical protein
MLRTLVVVPVLGSTRGQDSGKWMGTRFMTGMKHVPAVVLQPGTACSRSGPRRRSVSRRSGNAIELFDAPRSRAPLRKASASRPKEASLLGVAGLFPFAEFRQPRPLVPPVHVPPVRHRLVHQRVQVRVVRLERLAGRDPAGGGRTGTMALATRKVP